MADALLTKVIGATNLEAAQPQKVLRLVCDIFERICVAVSFGRDSVALLHMLHEIKPGIDVVFINTGYAPPQTLRFAQQLVEAWNLRVQAHTPAQTVAEQAQRYGTELYRTQPRMCCCLRRAVPLRHALQHYDAWITGLRREETVFRKQIHVVEARNGIIQVNPLAAWTEQDVSRYIRTHQVPNNPLYDLGFRGLSCWPCMRALDRGRRVRATPGNGCTLADAGLPPYLAQALDELA